MEASAYNQLHVLAHFRDDRRAALRLARRRAGSDIDHDSKTSARIQYRGRLYGRQLLAARNVLEKTGC